MTYKYWISWGWPSYFCYHCACFKIFTFLSYHLIFKLFSENEKSSLFWKSPTWFLYVLSKYQGMFKILKWNAMLRKTPNLKIARSSPRNSVFIGHTSNPPDLDEMSNLYRGLSIDAFYQVSVHLAKRFQRRRI
jgi:hypothetical protein